MLLILCVFALIIFISESESTIKPERIPDVVDFNFHIRPILSDRCFKCHGPDANQRKADLRLDTKEGLYQTLKDDPEGHIVIPGESKDSELYRRVTQEDTSLVMPPPNSKLSLTDYEKRLIIGDQNFWRICQRCGRNCADHAFFIHLIKKCKRAEIFLL